MIWRLVILLMLAQVSAMAAASRFFIIEGDSIPYGTSCSGGDVVSNQWNQVINRLNARSIPLYLTNIADPGDMIQDMTAGGSFTNAEANAAQYSNTFYVVSAGLNNIAVGDSVAFTTNCLWTNFNNVRIRHPDWKIVACTILNAHASDWDTTRSNRVINFNEMIRSNWVGADYVLDAVNDSIFDVLSTYCTDQTHPKATPGYSKLADYTMTFLETNNLLGQVWNVRKDGSDSNTGTTNSATGAFLTIAKAESVANSLDRIYVAQGLYPEVITHNAGTNIIYYGTSVTNGGFVISKAYTGIMGLGSGGWECNGTNMSSAHIEYSGGINGGQYCWLSNVTIRGYGAAASNLRGINNGFNTTGSTTNLVLDTVRFINTTGHGIDFAGRGHRLTNCFFESTNGWDAIRLVASDVSVRRCTFTNWSNPGDWNPNHTDLFQSLGDNSDTCTNVLIAENFAINCWSCQLGNFSDDQEDHAISKWTFRNNFFGEVSSTMNVYAPTFLFYYNTFWQCASNGGQVISFGGNGNGHGSNATLIGNIFYKGGNPTDSAGGYYYSSDDETTNGLTADYNLVVGSGAGTTKQSGSGGWGRIGTEVHGLNGSVPIFTSAATLNFTLAAGSPGLDAGLTIASFSFDRSGTSRPQGIAWDMGSEEGGGGGGSAPSAPSGLNAAAVSGSRIDLTWTDNASDETGFEVQRDTASNFATATTIGGIATDTVSYQSTGLSAATTYYYRVRATNSFGASSYTSTANATTLSTIQSRTGNGRPVRTVR